MKFNIKKAIPNTLAGIIAVVLAFHNHTLGSLAILAVIISMFGCFERKKDNQEAASPIEKIYEEIDAINYERIRELPIPLTMIGEKGQILWFNNSFEDNFLGDKKQEEGTNLKTAFKVDVEDLIEGKIIEYEWDEVSYLVEASPLTSPEQNTYLVHFFDVTLQSKCQDVFRRNEPVFCYLLIDNYDDIVEQLQPTERSSVLSKIDIKLTEWANSMDSFIIGYEKDHYIQIIERSKLKEMEMGNFRILDEIRKIEISERTPVTLSIGIGVSDEALTINEANSLSYNALDLALARGGDQAVVFKDETMVFYGGETEATEKRTKVKARVKAHALRELMDEADNVLIMGHATPDMDCLGAAIGLIGACRDSNIQAKLVLKEINYSIKAMFDYIKARGGYEDVFITPEESIDLIARKTLMIIVDTQNAEYLEAPELLEKVSKIVVIDHHRRSGKHIESTVLSYTEPYASSTCELVTELSQYLVEKDPIDETEANVLLAGICMDTKMFTIKTGVRTFEAAAYLKRRGGDTVIAKKLLQDDLETYSIRSDVVKRADIYFDGFAISELTNDTAYAKVIASQSADDLLNIKGVNASFIILNNKKNFVISGRSMGAVNVQLILEKLGGGGHMTMAGAQLLDLTDPVDAKKELLHAIEEYLQERETE